MIWFILNLMLTRWLSMKRWNNFPRIEDVSHLDNVWFVIHIALFLAYLEEKEWNKIDREFLIKRIIFNSFSSLILSDINSWTKEYILNFNENIFNELEKKAFDVIINKESPENIKNDIINTINDNTKKLELKIIKASKRYAWYHECLINSTVFRDMYEVPLNTIKIDLEKQKLELKSLNILLENDNYLKYLSHIRRLSHSLRWNQQTRIFPISVMSHLVITTFILYIIWSIESEEKYNIEELLLRSIYHDIPEAITWDIITPTKKSIEWFDKILEEVEIKMMDDYIFSNVWEDYKKIIAKYIFSPFDWEYWKIAKYADVLSALFEAKVEVNYWWKNFFDIYKNIKNKTNSFWIKSVDYFLKYWIDSFDETINNINLN